MLPVGAVIFLSVAVCVYCHPFAVPALTGVVYMIEEESTYKCVVLDRKGGFFILCMIISRRIRMEGVITALITPFKGGELDEGGLRANIRFQIEGGVDGLLALGSTGEGEALTDRERRLVIQIAREESLGRLPLWIQTGDSSTTRAIEKTGEAERLGADGVLVIAPYLCCPTQEGLFRHFEAIARSTTLPITLYHHPKRTGVSFEIATLKRLATIENIVGLKEACGNVGFIAEVLNTIEDFILFSGDDMLSLPLMSIGAKGVFSVLSNAMPRQISQLVREKGEAHYRALFPLFQLAQCETNPIPIKAIMDHLGMAGGVCRLPLTPLSIDHQKEMEHLLLAHV